MYDLTADPNGHTLGILSYRSGYGDRIRAYVLASSGSMLWQAQAPGIYPRMSLEADGVRTAVGYTEVLRSGARTGYHRKVAYYDGQGDLLWEKGGLFFSPQLLGAVTPGPGILARGEASNLYLMDERGGITGHYLHPALIRRTEVAWHSRSVLVWDVRNVLTYLQWRR